LQPIKSHHFFGTGSGYGKVKKNKAIFDSQENQRNAPPNLRRWLTTSSRIIKTFYHSVVKTYSHAPRNPEKPAALLTISTGVAATNIHLMVQPLTQHQQYLNLQMMSDQNRTQMRLPHELKLIIIDEICPDLVLKSGILRWVDDLVVRQLMFPLEIKFGGSLVHNLS